MNKFYKVSLFISFIIISIISSFYFFSINYSKNIIENKTMSMDLMIRKEMNIMKKDSDDYIVNKTLFERNDFISLKDN